MPHSAFSPADLSHYHRVVTRAVNARNHFDVLVWLQGDMQLYLPHDILIAAWGNFATGTLRYDIISSIEGVRSNCADSASCPAAVQCMTPLLKRLFSQWTEFGKKPFSYAADDGVFLRQDPGLQCALGAALGTMRSAMVHGIIDERGSHNCLYVAFNTQASATDMERGAMAMVLPYIDIALRQVLHLPHQLHSKLEANNTALARLREQHDLSARELEVLDWVTRGKTNPEIGLILDISEFTVKNHMQRVFRKLNVSNRAQAVGKLQALATHV